MAVVTEVGGGLRILRSGARDLVARFAAEDFRPVYRGAVLAPGANRVADSHYRWQGEQHQLPLTEPERGNALHGLVCLDPWRVVASEAASLALTTSI